MTRPTYQELLEIHFLPSKRPAAQFIDVVTENLDELLTSLGCYSVEEKSYEEIADFYAYIENGLPSFFEVYGPEGHYILGHEKFVEPNSLFNQKPQKEKDFLLLTDTIQGVVYLCSKGYDNSASFCKLSNPEKVIKAQFKYLNQFHKIYYFCQESQESYEINEHLSKAFPSKFFSIPFGFNDWRFMAHDLRVEDWMKKAVVPQRENIISSKEIDHSSLWEYIPQGLKTHFSGIDNLLGGIRLGELTTLTGDTGSGKTTFALNVIYRLVCDDIPCYISSCEMRWQVLLQKIASLQGRKSAREGQFSDEDKEDFRVWCQKKSFFYNLHGERMTLEGICEEMDLLARCHGVKVFLLEDLGFFASSIGRFEQERQGIEYAMRTLHSKALELSVHVLLVVHPKQSPDDRGIVSMSSLKGTSGIKQYSDNVLGVQRMDRMFPDDVKMKSAVRVTVMKNRVLGREGAFYLEYNPEIDGYTDCLSPPKVSG